MIGSVHILTQQTTRQLCCTFFSGHNFFLLLLLCLYFDTTDGYLRFISTVSQTTVTFFSDRNFFSSGSKNIAGQTTVPFFPVVIFLGPNWCSYFDTSTNYGTYIRPEKNTTRKKKVQSSGQLCFLAGSNYNRKKLWPEKKGTVIWPTVEINLR